MLGAAVATPASAATPDAWIISVTKRYVLTGSQTPAVGLTVDTREGGVRLWGIVSPQEGKAGAIDVRNMSGGQCMEKEGEILDEEVGREVKKAFTGPAFKDITVAVKNGVVRLTGTIPGWAWHREAVAVARAIPGVRAVEDELHFMVAV
jgi:osmotically-inducible protein OsmY